MTNPRLPLRFRSDMTVELIQWMGGDLRVVQAARTSTAGTVANMANTLNERGEILIHELAAQRHGSPFEHVVFTFRIETIIAVWREIMRHRIASYSEESGRYKELEGVFYLPDGQRKITQTGRPMEYRYDEGTDEQYDRLIARMENSLRDSYEAYLASLDDGISKEIARLVLPVDLYSSGWMTMNLRSIFNFLSLRTEVEGSHYPSHPMKEIQMVADQIEAIIAEKVPVAHAAFVAAGRVSP